ncbi:MAG TPA: M23 family metallopeptidase [Candidatus Dormibacteraeota bacterium]|nr:M23 family metallopeptidase [Candidatus Dormibacteraeota bacterium]
MTGWGALFIALLQLLFAAPSHAAPAPPAPTPAAADVFQFPLTPWAPHCLGFGSQWRYCNGVPLRSCASGAVWLHTGTDEVASVGEPVAAAGDGVIVGYLIDPQFRGGVLIRHQTTAGTVITQYWHVWMASGFAVGMAVKRGQVFAHVADMGDKTHFHFAVFNGPLESHSWNGALPPNACSGFPAFPYKFIDPTAFIDAHLPPPVVPREIRF